MNRVSNEKGSITILLLIVCMMMSVFCLIVLRSAFLTQLSVQDVLHSFYLQSHARALKICCARLCIIAEKSGRLDQEYNFRCDRWPWREHAYITVSVMCRRQQEGTYGVTLFLDDHGAQRGSFKGVIHVNHFKGAIIQEWAVI